LIAPTTAGRGRACILLAPAGRTVVAVDPAEASLDVAKAKDAAAPITWIHGDATAVPCSMLTSR
jgi:ubiquinone/menaquinone biosynthesis C-methylase UbiE